VVSTIGEWLKSLGMSEYTERFVENRIDISVLRDLTDQDLKDLGVILGDRRKMLRAIGELFSAASALNQTTAPRAPRESAERRQLTVMFCDLVGSTALSARLDPEDLRGVISAYHRCCEELIDRNGGFVAKYMGDGVLAYFGYPQAHEHDAERAVRAGLSLVEAVPKLATNDGSPLQVRVGIATGLVVVGDLIGAGASQEQAVVGETPNLASRLQALAEPGTVVIAASTHRLTGGLFEYRDLGSVMLKGFADNVPVWQVLAASAAESRFEALRATTIPLVGRGEEIDLLVRRWEQVKRGVGCVVLISGEPGIGKSRIAQTILERLGAEPHTRLRYFCSPYHQDSALYPSITQLERAAGLRREDSANQRLDKLEAVLARGTNDLSEAVPLLADLLSIPTGGRYPPLNLTPQKRKGKTLGAQLTQVEGLASRQPVLMVWEDVHWSDPTTRESLDLLIDCVPKLRVLVIITFRPEFTPPWIGRPHVTLLSLSRLPDRQRAEMITYVTGGKALPKEIADQIVHRTDGVPLFIEELTKSVLESGILTETDDGYAASGSATALAIPTTLHASLLARLDHLAPTREAAQIGAALGRSFSHELISGVAEMPQPQLDDALMQLVRAELIFQRGTVPDAEYTFKHALVQEAAYSTLLRSRRHQLHARIVARLENQFPESVTAQPQLIAQHCENAALNEKAAEYWLKAGQLSIARSAMSEAVTQLQKGLVQLAGLPETTWRQQQELGLQIALGAALIATRGYAAPEVHEAYVRAGVLTNQISVPEQLLPVLYGRCVFHIVRSEYKLALPLAEQIMKVSKACGSRAWELYGDLVRGIVLVFLGEFMGARSVFEENRELNDPAHRAVYGSVIAEDPYAVMVGYLAQTLTYLGYMDQGRSRMGQALSEARRLDHPHTLAFVLCWACIVHKATNSPVEVAQYAEEFVAVATEHGFPLWLGFGIFYRGWSLAMLEEPRRGLPFLTDALRIIRATGAVISTPFVLVGLGEAYLNLDQPVEGLNCIAEAEEIVAATNERYWEAELYRVRGDLLIVSGDRSAAEQCFHRALDVARRQRAKTFELRATTSLARLWRDEGKRTEACDLLAPICGWFTEGFDTPVLQEAKALLDQLKSYQLSARS
jgi:class 3 adenylate cyclase/predicted ATPase